jgi:protocatechuate 3,4-dioxygenase beta subunit
MQRKHYLLFLVGFTLLLVVGVVAILQQDEGDGFADLGARDAIAPADTDPAAVEDTPAAPVREVVTPEELPVLEEGSMPASYRRALGVLKGRVVEADSTPVPDTKVEVYSFQLQDLLRDAADFMMEEPPEFALAEARTRTADNGTFRFTDIQPLGLHALAVDLGGARATSRIIDCVPNPGETVDLGDIVLAPHAVIKGVLKDGEGNPVQGARVRATELPPVVFISGMQDFREGCSFLMRWSADHVVFELPPMVRQLFRLMPFPTTTSGSDGAFRLEGVPLALVSLVVDRPGFVTLQHPVSTARGGEKDVGELALDRGVKLEGKVVNHLGEPVEGAEVRVGPMYGIPEMVVLQPSIYTDGGGAFTYPGAAPRSYFAAARRYDEDPWVITGPFHPELEPPELVLEPAYDLRLLVKREDGAPAERVLLKIQSKESFGEFMPFQNPTVPKDRMKVRDEGVVEVENLAKGRYELLISARGCGVAKETVNIRDEAVDREVILKPAYTASVLVLTEKTRKPLEWANVYATSEADSWWVNPTKLSKGRTDAEGRAVLKNLSPGTYKVTVSHPAWAVTAGSLEVPAEDEVVILIRPGGVLEGVVHSAGSTDEAPYLIALNLEDGEIEAAAPRMIATDLEGRFRVTNLNAGAWEVTVLKRVLDKDPLGLSEVIRRGPLADTETEVWSGETSFLEINLGSEEMGPAGSVSGKVRVNGKPATGALVSTYSGRRFESTVDPSGDYDLGRIPVGTHSLHIEQLPGKTGQYDSTIRRSIEVVENETLFEDFEILTGSITGRVVYESDNSPARGIKISAGFEDEDAQYRVRLSTVTDVEGRFLLEGVPIGSYTVKAEDRKLSCSPVSGVKVFPGGKAGPVILTMITPIWVRGRVVIPEAVQGSRWVGLIVRPSGGKDQDWQWIRLDRETGEFETDRLVPGSYEASFVGEGKDEYEKMPFMVPPGGVSNLVFVPEKKQDEK